uniref:Uncharacterized protein n=1 Tax=Rhizophora mucronata TaxID=61149 RepID=A0A2P2NK03_RHIMU
MSWLIMSSIFSRDSISRSKLEFPSSISKDVHTSFGPKHKTGKYEKLSNRNFKLTKTKAALTG